MGVSFKVSKNGRRFRPKPPPLPETSADDDEVLGNSKESSRIVPGDELSTRKLEGGFTEVREDVTRASENEVSFTLKLFADGYSIGKPSENGPANSATLQDAPKDLRPYDRRSETLFSAIESGRLPGDILEDIPCKYVDGTVVCEQETYSTALAFEVKECGWTEFQVQDYRKYTSEQGSSALSGNDSPIISKISLKMSLENVVKDIPRISDSSWTYGDLMEVESSILKALQPQLCLDPTPKLDRLSNAPVPVKLNLAQYSLRMKRLRQAPEITVTSNNKSYGKKISIDRAPESSNSRLGDSGIISGNIIPQHVQDNLTVQNYGPNNLLASRPRSIVPEASSSALPMPSHQLTYHTGVGNHVLGASPAGQDTMISYTDNMNPSTLGKRDNLEGPISPVSAYNKRVRLASFGSDGVPQQQIGSHIDGLHGSDLNWRNTVLQQQMMARGIQFSNAGIQKYSQQVLHGVLNQEQFDGNKVDASQLNPSKNSMMEAEMNHLDHSRLQQRLPQNNTFMKSSFSPSAWNNLGQHVEKDSRKVAQSPRLSNGAMAQSPLSSRSGEFSSGSAAPHYGAVTSTMSIGSSQKEKSAVTLLPGVGGTQSLTSSANDSMQRQHKVQAAAAAKRRSNSLSKASAISGVGSPVSVSNMSGPLNANSPSVGTPPLFDQTMLERFSKIEMVTMRHQLNCKKKTVDNYPIRKAKNYSAQELFTCLSNISNNEDFKDDTRPLSKSLVGGSMNVCKSRVLNFKQSERVVQGNIVSIIPEVHTQMVLSEKLNGSVVMYYGDLQDQDFLGIEDYLPTLPNNHLADLLASQLCDQMIREGYQVEDHIQQKPARINQTTASLSNVPGIQQNISAAEMQQQYVDAVSGHQSNEAPKPSYSSSASLNSSQGLVANARMLSPGNSQALQMSQGLLSGVSMPTRPQQLEQQNQQSLLQQQHPQFQRSSALMFATNQLSSQFNGQGSSMQFPNHMVDNKPSPLQLQMLQQQVPQQQQQQFQRKMMAGFGTSVTLGNMGNNMIGLGGLGNVMGMGGGAGISAPMGSSGGQNPMYMSQAMNMGGGGGISGSMGTSSGMGGSVGHNPMNMSQATNMGGSGISGQMGTISGMGGSVSQNPMNMSQATNMGGAGISGQMGTISGMGVSVGQNPMNMSQATNMGGGAGIGGNTAQNPMTLSQAMHISNAIAHQLRAGTLSGAQAAMMQQKLRTALGRGGNMVGAAPQAGMAGMSGARQMHPGSTVGQTQNRPNMNPMMQRTVTGPMGPPKLMAGVNPYMNQQQQYQQQLQQLPAQQQQFQQPPAQQHQHMQLQQQQPLQQQQQQPQQQETTSPLQTVVSPPQVDSSSTMGIPQPQQMNQRTPMSPQQTSSGAIHATTSANNPDACPASPQLSSHSITNSSMDMQGVNKSNSASNA